MVALDRTSLQKNLDDMLASPLKWGARHPIEALRMISEYGEAATRLGEYGQAKRKGATPREAALASRDVTLDFARVGAKTQAVNSIIAFWNATVQGTDKFVAMHKLNPRMQLKPGTRTSWLRRFVNRHCANTAECWASS